MTRAYDDGSRLNTEVQRINGVDYTVGYGYDAANRQTAVIYPNGKAVTRTFTDRNQLDLVYYDGSHRRRPRVR